MYVTPEGGRPDLEVQKGVEVVSEPPHEVIWGRITLMNERILAVDNGYSRLVLFHGRHVWIVVPKRLRRGGHSREIPPGIAGVKITDRGRKHQDISGALIVLK